MAIRSGLAGQFGLAEQSAYTTYATPTRFLEIVSENLAVQIERIESRGIRAGNRVLRGDRWVANRKGATGPVTLEVADKGFGLLFKHMLGTAVVGTAPGGTATFRHRHTLADHGALNALTLQVGRPNAGGTVPPFDYIGAMVANWELSCDVDGILQLSTTWDAYNEQTSGTLAAASYAGTASLLTYTGGSVAVDGTAVAVRNVSLQGNNGLATGRYFVRASTLKKQPVPAAMAELSGSMEMEFEDSVAYNRFVNGTLGSVVMTFTGPITEGTFTSGVTITLPYVRFDGETPNLSGVDILSQPLPFKVLSTSASGGTAEPITLDYFTLDNAS